MSKFLLSVVSLTFGSLLAIGLSPAQAAYISFNNFGNVGAENVGDNDFSKMTLKVQDQGDIAALASNQVLFTFSAKDTLSSNLAATGLYFFDNANLFSSYSFSSAYSTAGNNLTGQSGGTLFQGSSIGTTNATYSFSSSNNADGLQANELVGIVATLNSGKSLLDVNSAFRSAGKFLIGSDVVGYSGSSNQDSFYVGTPDFRLVTSPGATWQSVPPSFTNVSDPGTAAGPEPLTMLGAGVAAGLGSLFKKRFNQSQDKS